MKKIRLQITSPLGEIDIFAPFLGTTEKTLDYVLKCGEDCWMELISLKPIGDLRGFSADVDLSKTAPTIFNAFKDGK